MRFISKTTMAALWQAVVSKSPTYDWAKSRVLILIVTIVALIWATNGIVNLMSPVDGTYESENLTERNEVGPDGQTLNNDQSLMVGRLRNDLFKIPKTKKENTRKTPKTNPVELLGLIELQGVLGGKTPKAIILYKRTQKTSTVSVGDDLGEFMVVEIRDRSVILKWRDELFELSL